MHQYNHWKHYSENLNLMFLLKGRWYVYLLFITEIYLHIIVYIYLFICLFSNSFADVQVAVEYSSDLIKVI